MTMTTEQYLQLALEEMKKATWSPERWCAAIQEGYPPGHEYNWMITHNFMAQQAMWNAAHPPAPIPKPPPPPPGTGATKARYVNFAAQEPQKGLQAPPKYALCLSADLAYRYPNDARPDLDLHTIIKAARDRGQRVPGWCDCRPAPSGTPASVGVEFVKSYGLDYFIGQCEDAAQFDDAYNAGARVMVGDITHLNQDQVDRIVSGEVLLIQEDYWNEGWNRAVHPAITAYCAGIYPTALWNPQIGNYQAAGRWRDGDGLYHVAEVLDWQNLP